MSHLDCFKLWIPLLTDVDNLFGLIKSLPFQDSACFECKSGVTGSYEQQAP